MVHFTDVQLQAWLGALLWPLSRILGIFSSAPLLSHGSVPVQSRVGLALFMAVLVAPALPAARQRLWQRPLLQRRLSWRLSLPLPL